MRPNQPPARWLPMWLGVLCLLTIASAARAADKPRDVFGGTFAPAVAPAPPTDSPATVRAVLDASALQPGKPAKLAVVIDVREGYHAQSHTPAGKFDVPTVVTVNKSPGLTFGEPAYPAGEDKNYPAVGKLNVYNGRAVVLVPVEVAATVAAGTELPIAGELFVQVCDDKGICLSPVSVPFEVKAKVVAAGEAVVPAEPELFKSAAAAPPAVARPAAVVAEENPLAGYSLPAIFGIALLVGLLFNVVPCVLPVLPLKAIGFYETAQHSRARSVTYGAAFSLGVMASFAVLGLLVVVLRKFTWGELFSNPYFAGALVVILVAMSLNMFGLFTVNLPAGAYMFSPRHDTYFGNFLYGILTAALSTPCTFGLFVSLIGVALTLTPAVGLLLIVAVGAGMASPYLVLSALPELARKFPRSGPWAELVKQFMGFMLLAVAVFFAQGWLGKVMGNHNVWWVIFGVVAAGALFLQLKAIKHGKTATAPIVAAVIAVLLVAPSFYAARLLSAKPYDWQPYTPETLTAARSANRVVLVEFTATWCSNCHALEAIVLNRKDVQLAVQDKRVQMIKADLTDTKAPGWALLRDDLKAAGVPLTVIYAPGVAEPIKLTGIYSPETLKAAIDKAASGGPVAIK